MNTRHPIPFFVACLYILIFVSISYAQTLDAYQGYAQLHCPSGQLPVSCVNGTSNPCHFYLAEIRKRWVFCDPAGNQWWFKGIAGAGSYNGTTQLQATITSKYGQITNPSYAPTAGANSWTYNYLVHTSAFMQNLGFNTLSDGSNNSMWPTNSDVTWNTTDHSIPDAYKLPYNLPPLQITANAINNTQGCGSTSPIKDLMVGQSLNATAGAWQFYNYLDYEDPQFPPCADNQINPVTNPGNELSGNATGHSSPFHGDYLLYATLDESDETGFVNAGTEYLAINADGSAAGLSLGVNAGYLALVTSPYQASGDPTNGSQTTYVDKEVHTKVDFANLMADRYVCTGNGTSHNGALPCCTGAGTGTCSVDPASASYIGNTNMTATNTIGATSSPAAGTLNANWGSQYTTFGTSDSNCTSNLATCLGYSATSTPGTITYNSWLSAAACQGSGAIALNHNFPATCCTAFQTGATCATEGTGLIDENGSDFSNHAWMNIDSCSHNASGVPTSAQTCGTGRNATPAAMAADLDAYGYKYVYDYMTTLITKFHSYIGYNIPLNANAGGASVPPHAYFLQAAAAAGLNMLTLTMPFFTVPSDEAARESFLITNWGNHPWIDWPQLLAAGDSSESGNNNFPAGQVSTSQSGRDTSYDNNVAAMLSLQSASGDHPIVGLFWWLIHDVDQDTNNWGLATRWDNAYDGVLDTTTSHTDSYGPLNFTTTPEPTTMLNSDCLSSAPYPYYCCTGNGTGTCPATAPANGRCSATNTPYPWCTGSHTGTANGSYGDFVDTVRTANATVFGYLAASGTQGNNHNSLW